MPTTPDKIEARREKVLDTAEKIIARDGVSALTARSVAKESGLSVGLIYSHFGDLDGLVLAANSRFIAKLDAALAEAPVSGTSVTERYTELALTYLRFGIDHRRQWAALFEHRMAGGRAIPDWHLEEHLRMFRHVAEPLLDLAPGMPEADRYALARTIYSSVHGIVSLGLETRLGKVPVADLEGQVEQFVAALVIGLETTLSSRSGG